MGTPSTALDFGTVGASSQYGTGVREENCGQALKKSPGEAEMEGLHGELTAEHL